MVVMMVLSGQHLCAQIISPGKLSAPHSTLDGIRNCTACHQLRSRGTVDNKCLDCHQPVATRLAAGTGLHATFPAQTCSNCHKEHGGTALDILRFDSTAFDHNEAGFTLRGRHEQTACRDCHSATLIHDPAVRRTKEEANALARTFLGLDRECTSCHVNDDPHAGQFPERTCDVCHTEQQWAETPGFDHAATRYPLTGLHRRVECQQCHATGTAANGASFVRYRPISFQSCASCHSDVHNGTMGARCTDCHATAGWARVDRSRVEDRFNHSTTGFLLVGQHASAPCASCHQFPPTRTAELSLTIQRGTETRTFPTPVAANCLSCHVDYHDNAFATIPGGPACENCHDQSQWFPAGYDLARHNRDAAFTLTGAHAALSCMLCHQLNPASPRLTFQLTTQTCVSCHVDDDPHQSQFVNRTCDSCHDTRAFTVSSFDHVRTRFALDEAHENVPCQSCHIEQPGTGNVLFVLYTPLGTACRDCHGE